MKLLWKIAKVYFIICAFWSYFAAIIKPGVWWGYLMMVWIIAAVWYCEKEIERIEEKEWLENIWIQGTHYKEE